MAAGPRYPPRRHLPQVCVFADTAARVGQHDGDRGAKRSAIIWLSILRAGCVAPMTTVSAQLLTNLPHPCRLEQPCVQPVVPLAAIG